MANNIIRHNLTLDGKSWVDVFELPQNLLPTQTQFNKLYNLHPEDKGIVKIFGKEIEVPRWQQPYGKNYKFSGIEHEALPIPVILKKYLDYANEFNYKDNYDNDFNMMLLNWYENGSHYIGYHSDDEKEMEINDNNESVVFSISLGQDRDFYLKNKKTNVVTKIPMKNGTVLVMGGKTQKTHKHSVPKISGAKGQELGRRINITMRIFKD